MKTSEREKKLMTVLALVVVAVLYYQFGFTTLTNLTSMKAEEKQQIQKKYESAKATIDSMENQKAKVKILNAKITNEALPFYPIISQEHIILEIDKLIKESGLEGGMTFEEVKVKGVEVQNKSAKNQDLSKSSMQGLADEYSYKYASEQDKKIDNNSTKVEINDSNKNTSENSGTPDSNSSNTKNDKSKDNGGNTVAQLHLNVDFNGSYKDVVKFLESLRTYGRKMPAYSINMSTKNLDEVKGSVNMMIYAIPKIQDELGDYLIWTLNNTYGKAKPFTVNSDVGTGIKTNKEVGDFMVSAKSINSDLPTVMIGKSNDSLTNTYVYADSNTEAQAEMILTKVGDRYYYKYKVKDSSIPEDYNGNGNEFIPNGENISLQILSENRVTSEDKSGLKLKIVNNTNKLIMVEIKGDDTTDPRISIDGDSKNITISKK